MEMRNPGPSYDKGRGGKKGKGALKGPRNEFWAGGSCGRNVCRSEIAWNQGGRNIPLNAAATGGNSETPPEMERSLRLPPVEKKNHPSPLP
ncbi:hypothetical protein CEXT_48511 [Caerostris extrusa]|uniref:Uncharacterized protein n=1 Tax=Caerostris extrusa TaxID=172846 RepID=A0AAV4N247_CAEEX|nr:hypothetical protein CEXT_48511 [Caerostris extrusa]